jgi:ornithine cyclodeaminase
MDVASQPPPRHTPVFIDGHAIERAITIRAAVECLERVLASGFDPELDAPRSRVNTNSGQFLQMPSTSGNYVGTKLLTINPANASAGLPVIQGIYALFGGPDQRPLAVLDGLTLTNLRTPAVSAMVALRLASPGPKKVLVFGTGTQAWEHIKAFSDLLKLSRVGIVGRNRARAQTLVDRAAEIGLNAVVCGADAVQEADLVICCTSSSVPLFDGSQVKDTAIVIAIGSHEPGNRELDDMLMSRATVYVESRTSSLREAGDVIQAMSSSAIPGPESLITLTEMPLQSTVVPHGRPAVFKSTGMPWQDLAIAAAVFEAVASEARIAALAADARR